MDKYITDSDIQDSTPENKVQDRVIKVVVLLIMLAFGGVLIWLFLQPQYLKEILLWIKEQGYFGNVIICLSFVLIAFPFAFTGYTILALASGFLYGIIAGEITAFIGANILGTTASYWVCSKLAKKFVEKQISSRKQLKAFLKIVQQHGFKIALLFRFTPIPYGIQNGVFSISGLDYKKFMLAGLGLVPEQCMWVYFGGTARRITDIVTGKVSVGPLQIVMMVVEVAVIIVICIVFVFFARRALKKTLNQPGTAREQLMSEYSSTELNPPNEVLDVPLHEERASFDYMEESNTDQPTIVNNNPVVTVQ